LDDANAVEHFLQLALRHCALGAGGAEALRNKCKLARIASGELDRAGWQRAVAAPMCG
jgi:hypothetical protein